MSPPPPPPSPSGWSTSLNVVLPLVVPSGGGVALLYYLGLKRNESYYRFFGLSADTVDLDVTHQVRESADVVIMAAIALLIVSLVYFAGIGFFRVASSGAISLKARRVVIVVGSVLLAGIFFGLIILNAVGPVAYAALALPIMIGVVAVLVVVALQSRASAGPVALVIGIIGPGLLKAFKVVFFFAAIIAISVTSVSYALVIGRADAEMVSQNLATLPGVSVFAKHDLPIPTASTGASHTRSAPAPSGSSISTTTISGNNGVVGPPPPVVSSTEFPYSYTGLRILAKVGNNYLLISNSWKPGAGEIYSVLDTDQDIRLDFLSK